MKMNFEKLANYIFACMFAGAAVFCLAAGFMGYRWHFYTCILGAIIAVMIFAVIRNENNK